MKLSSSSIRLGTALATLLLATVAAAALALSKDGTTRAGAEDAQPTNGAAPLFATPTANLLQGVTEVKDAFVRQQDLKPGEKPDQEHGIYFLNTRTGRSEGWTLKGKPSSTEYEASDDNQWVIAPREGFILNRKTGQNYSWDPTGRTFAGAWGDRVLFADGLEYHLVDASMSLVVSFRRPVSAQLGVAKAIMSPDGSMLAFISGTGVVFVDLETGTQTAILGPVSPNDSNGVPLMSIDLQPATNGTEVVLVARYTPQTWNEPSKIRLHFFDWQKGLVGEVQGQAFEARVSPDGRYIAWERALRTDGFTDGFGGLRDWAYVAVTDRNGDELFNVRGVALCFADKTPDYAYDLAGRRWLGDSSALVVSTREGFGLVTVAGRGIQPLSVGSFPQPAPGNSALFAAGRTEVVNAQAKTVASIAVGGAVDYSLDPWGATAEEMRVATTVEEEKAAPAACGAGAGGSASVMTKTPGPDIKLKITAEGDCLNLRDQPGTQGNVLTCAADNTLLDVTEGAFAPIANEFASFQCGAAPPVSAYHGWVHVRLPSGLEGWVNDDFVDWAD